MNNRGLSTIKIPKWAFVVAAIVIILLAAVLAAFADPIQQAVLTVEYGDVQVDQGNGFGKVQGKLSLQENAKIKTGEGSAVLILFESMVTIIDPHTELDIEELVKASPRVRQDKGVTWNKFTALSGMQSFATETPTAVAVARATGYEVHLDSILVVDGAVEVTADKAYMVHGLTALVQEGPMWNMRNLTGEERARLVERLKKTAAILQKLRLDIIEEHSLVYASAKKMAGFNDEQRDAYFAQVDHGERDINADYQKSLVKHAVAQRVVALSQEIKKINDLVKELS